MYLGKKINDILSDNVILSATQTYIASSTALTGSKILNYWNSIHQNKHDAFNSTTGVYTIPTSGMYYFNFFISTNSSYGWDFYFRNGNNVQISEVASVNGNGGSQWVTTCCFLIGEYEEGDSVHVYHGYHEGTNYHLRYTLNGTLI